MNEETNKETSATIAGSLTVNLNLKGSKRRYNPGDLKTEVAVNFGGKITEIEAALDAELASLRTRILIACGRANVES